MGGPRRYIKPEPTPSDSSFARGFVLGSTYVLTLLGFLMAIAESL